MERRGRVRSEEARTAVLTATRDLTIGGGYAHLTIEKIAAQSGVSKATIYRWWSSKNAILAECVLEGMVLPDPGAAASDAIGIDAADWFRAVLAYIDEPDTTALLRGIVAASYEDPTIARLLYERLGAPIEARFTQWLQSANARGTVPAAVTAGAAAQVLFGSILVRLALWDDADEDATAAVFDAITTSLELGGAPAAPAP
ncbi:TetR/AcrR family transcriptional regulator [Glaciihabitans sp. dw_435]|uniref:TetR/AcrR family transcriptional regulator n=1 Tax=Glaciihabitans sp. dw_435 TaxID=2720081 RepID=UPI001BD55F5D|nr:TetR/AcrR family transcriptional regulator [Glaciihabitans sp. dw_435]